MSGTKAGKEDYGFQRTLTYRICTSTTRPDRIHSWIERILDQCTNRSPLNTQNFERTPGSASWGITTANAVPCSDAIEWPPIEVVCERNTTALLTVSENITYLQYSISIMPAQMDNETYIRRLQSLVLSISLPR